MSKLQKTLSDIAKFTKKEWTDIARKYCQTYKIHMDSLVQHRIQQHVEECLGGGGIEEATFRVFNEQGHSVLKLYRVTSSSYSVQETEIALRQNVPPLLLNVLIPYKFLYKEDIVYVERRYLPTTLLRRLKFTLI